MKWVELVKTITTKMSQPECRTISSSFEKLVLAGSNTKPVLLDNELAGDMI
jgi:hypothetical protein